MFIFEGKTAEEWKAEAAASRKRAAESWTRSDTDGFLSQWASDAMARRYDHCAEVAENGGRVEVSAIFDLSGQLLSLDYREGQHGWYYLIPQANRGLTGSPFVTPSQANKAWARTKNNTKKGISEGTVSVPAYVERESGQVKPDMDAARKGDIQIVSLDAHQVRDY